MLFMRTNKQEYKRNETSHKIEISFNYFLNLQKDLNSN